MIFVGIAILIMLFACSTMIEKTLKNMEKQNETIIRLLEDLNNKNK
ncbi:hypothetical protein [Bacillus safensis]|nr:hypothetical protein [Bacillus safensis]